MDFFIIYGLAIISLIVTLSAQAFISASYSKYSKIRNNNLITGEQVARKILAQNGLNNIKVVETSGHLSDHYDPKNKVVRLSSSNFNNASVAAVSVACHECGHAIQDKDGYTFLRIRSSLVPIVNLCSTAGYISILLGSVFGALGLIWLGIIAELIILFFQIVTLPVEFNASKRGIEELKKNQMLNNEELKGGKTVLTAAALTYVASVATAIIQILRLILIYGQREK